MKNLPFRSPLEPDAQRWLNQLPEAAIWLDAGGRVAWLNPAAMNAIPDTQPLGKRLENWVQAVPQESRMFEPMVAPWWRGTPSKGLVRLGSETRWRWFELSIAPYGEGQLCILTEVTREYNQTLAYHSSLEVLSSLLTQEENLESLLQRILQSAVEVIPGAEAGSLLLLEGDKFRFAAQIGFSDELQQHQLDYQYELFWYGMGEKNWLMGQPRLLVAPKLQERVLQMANVEDRTKFSQNGSIQQIQASITVPVVLRGQVMATLNIDSLTSANAFGYEALAISKTFALQAATVLFGLLSRRHLQGLALTDPLTELGNRRALEEGYPKLKAQSSRLSLPLALIYWDLDGLKRLNDHLGHAAGDLALRAFAKALKHTARQSDSAFRVGGDEFVSLHLGLHQNEVPDFIARVRQDSQQAVSAGAVAVENQELHEALAIADRAMYNDKHQR
jgi:diguanylate cyclase (GGDEF)-like protein